VIHSERLVENAAIMGARLLAGLDELASRHAVVANVRGRGLFCAFTLPTVEERDRLRSLLWERGLATLASWPTSVRFRPCLNVSTHEVDAALDRLDDALGSLAGHHRLHASCASNRLS